jgi:hypothetical protein
MGEADDSPEAWQVADFHPPIPAIPQNGQIRPPIIQGPDFC